MQGDLELARATTLIRQGKLTDAENACRAVLTAAPRHPAATHLLGLICKDLGDIVGGERLLRESIELQPRQPEFKCNLAHLLRRNGRAKEAEALYREALRIDAQLASARAGLVRALSDQGQHIGAEHEARALIRTNDRDSNAWSLLAMSLREQQKLPEAEQAYRRAIQLAPGHPHAYNNLGSILNRMERTEEALYALERAEALGLAGVEVSFNRGIAFTQLLRLDEAERAFEQAVRMNPLHGEAQVNLARIRFMRGDPNFTRGIAEVAASSRANRDLHVLLSLVLRRAGDLQAAEALLRDVAKTSGPSPDVHAALAEVLLEGGRIIEAESEALQAAAARPDDGRFTDILVSILLARGRAEEALPFIDRQCRLHPLQQSWLAYRATAARLLGEASYHELYDYDRFVRIYDIEAPRGWSSIQELNDAVLSLLNERHILVKHPLDQSLRNGSQTARSLLAESDRAIQSLLKEFETPLRDYQQRIGSDPHPFTSRNRGAAKISAAWSVQLRREGFHVNHVHRDGWISSAYYVHVPEEVSDQSLMSGWLKFGEPRFAASRLGPDAVIQPRAGRLVLFPSYLWHGTNPIQGDEPRTTIAFDAVPDGAPST